jgi:hypothetical protein
MHLRRTSMQAAAHDACSHLLDSPGARAFVNADAESAASPALYNAFAERPQACPFSPLSHTLGDHPCSHQSPKHLQPLWASTGRMPNTLSADKSPVRRAGSSCVSHTGLQ